MPEFANRSEYEKWKAEAVGRMRKEEEERKVTWVCPACCSVLSISSMQCRCGYTAGQSLLPYFMGDVTSFRLYETVRNEFHSGDHEKALILSRYLVRRFPLSKEAEHLREYGEVPRRKMRTAEGLRGERGGFFPARAGASADRRRTKTVVAAISACLLGLALISLFLWHFPAKSTAPEQARNVPGLKAVPAGDERMAAEKMIEEKKEAEKSEAERLRSPLAQLGFKKGREIARVFLTNKPSRIREKCYKAMVKAGLRDTDYLVGCMTGYDSYGYVWGGPPETVSRSGLPHGS